MTQLIEPLLIIIMAIMVGFLLVEHFAAAVPADFPNPLLSFMMKTAVAKKFPRRAFTLIEIMVVVAIIGLIAAMGIPSILQSLQKDGMRKAVSDMKDVLTDAQVARDPRQ